MTPERLLIFDVDGVLVDPSGSYRETIIRTVEHFSGSRITRDDIERVKNTGGFNDDWALSMKLIRDAGFEPSYHDVVQRFERLFRGENGSGGLCLEERWLARDGLFPRLAATWQLAIFTGRHRDDAIATLRRFAPSIAFDPIIGNREVENQKPAPDGLLKICAAFPGLPSVYLGDTVDDARSARSAGVPFIGVAAASNSRRQELTALFAAEGARAVIESVNELEAVL